MRIISLVAGVCILTLFTSPSFSQSHHSEVPSPRIPLPKAPKGALNGSTTRMPQPNSYTSGQLSTSQSLQINRRATVPIPRVEYRYITPIPPPTTGGGTAPASGLTTEAKTVPIPPPPGAGTAPPPNTGNQTVPGSTQASYESQSFNSRSAQNAYPFKCVINSVSDYCTGTASYLVRTGTGCMCGQYNGHIQ
jgi:hypothetical protein